MNNVKIELGILNFSGCLELNQIDCKKMQVEGATGSGFSGREALPVNCILYSIVCRFKTVKDSAISDHRFCR